jgi:ribosomal protein L24
MSKFMKTRNEAFVYILPIHSKAIPSIPSNKIDNMLHPIHIPNIHLLTHSQLPKARKPNKFSPNITYAIQ